MFKKKIALLSLVSIISNFSLFTTNVLAYEIKENSKKIASTEVIKKDSSKNKKTSKAKKVITVAQNGNTHAKARDNLKMTYFGTDYQSTGIVAKPGEEFVVYVQAEENVPLPTIAFSQHEGFYSNWVRWYQLKPGKNVITVPEIYSNSWEKKTAKGGAVYLLNRYTKEEQGKAPVVTIEGGETFPLYNEGDDKEQFLKELKEYKKKLDEDPENTVDLFEFNTNRILYTGTTSSAYKVYVEEGVDIEKSTNNLNSQIQEAFDFSGLKDDISDPSNDSTNIKTTIRLMQPYGLAYAYVDHVGIQRDYETSMLKTDKSSLGSVLWATVHEVGHQMDIDARAWPEITNNMWANNAHIKQGFDDRVNYTYIYKYLAPEKSLRGFEEMDYFQKLGMFWQLQLKKDTYWAELESLYRKRKPSPNNYQQKKDILATYSSEVLNINLTYYFEKYGFDLSDECKEKLKKYPTSNEKLWYLNSSVMNYEGQGFDNVDTNLDVTLSKSKSNIKLTMNINKSIKNDLLGYEIIKDGKVIGFTTESSYTDNEANDNSKYEVVPYAKNLTTGRNVEISSSTPNISLQQEKVTLKIGEDFNAKDYVKGFTYFGDDITSKIEVDSSVNTNECGTYTVKYTLTNENTTKQKSMEVEVVSDYDYLSDLSWESIKTDWGTPRKNGNIQGMTHGQVTKFKKGIGIHANGKITYDLSDKDYDKFEALVGIDTSIGQNEHSSDHSIIVNPKLTTNNGKPKFKGDDKIAFNINDKIDLLKGISVTDAEDGDLTSNIKMETDYIEGSTGIFNVNCSVIDKDKNKSTFTRTVVVSEKETYLSDLNWEYGTIGSGYIGKDKSVREETIQLLNENGTYEKFKKGIGTHAYSEIVYDSSGYDVFDTWVGLDKFVSNQNASSVIFKVYVDGELKAQTDVMKSNSPKERLIVDVRNSKKVKLVVEEADNGDTWDHADWADAKFRTFSKFDSTELENTLVEIKDKNLKLSIQQELGLPGEIRLGDMKDLVSLSVKNVKSLDGLQYAINLKSLNIENNEIKDLSPLKNLKKLTNLKANPQMIYEDLVLAKDKNVSVDYNILNRNGDKLTPTSISIKDNRTWEYTNLNVKDCIDEDGKISFSTENFYSGIHTVYLTYEDKVDNYTTNITFIVDTRER